MANTSRRAFLRKTSAIALLGGVTVTAGCAAVQEQVSLNKSTPASKSTETTTTGWTKASENPILELGSSWDCYHAVSPTLVKADERYHLLYAGRESADGAWQIGHATSTNLSEWTRDPQNPVLETGEEDTWDAGSLTAPAMTVVDDTVYCLYCGRPSDGSGWQVGGAVSSNFSDWTKLDANPLIQPGRGGRYDSRFVSEPAVYHDGRRWHAWFAANNGQHTQIGHATSSDYTTWTKSEQPAIPNGRKGRWDDTAAASATVLSTGGQYHLYYGAYDGGNWHVGYAQSPNLESWSKSHERNPVLGLGASGTWDSNRVSQPSVLFANGQAVMLYEGHDGTHYRIGLAEAKLD